MKKSFIYFVVVIVSFCLGFCSYLIYDSLNKDKVTKAIDKVYDSVVAIEAYDGNVLLSSSSGVVYAKSNGKAYILTNFHVLDGADKIKVYNVEGKESSSVIENIYIDSDIAVLSVPNDFALDVCTFGDSDNIKLGETILTVGSPINKKYLGTVTKGIISGIDQNVSFTHDENRYTISAIQIDAVINPGSSGSVLINLEGEVIGINALKLDSSDVEGMAFSIPINKVLDVINDNSQD